MSLDVFHNVKIKNAGKSNLISELLFGDLYTKTLNAVGIVGSVGHKVTGNGYGDRSHFGKNIFTIGLEKIYL